HQFVVHDNGRDTPFRFAGQIPALGARVRLEGNTAADGVLELGSAPTVLEPAPTPAASTGTQNAIFILVRFLDSGSLPLAESDVQAVAVTNGNSVANYFQEVSYGRATLNITVTPWVTAQMNTSTSCDYTTIGNYANSAATAAGYNVNNYTYKFYVMPGNNSC